jgi:thiosulfate/3-mercaptopyruvate sulfurtransferase
MTASRKRMVIAALGAVVVLLWGARGFAQDLPSKLVSTDWLADNYGQLDIRIIDMRQDIRDYWTSHLPAALYLSPEALRWPENGVPVQLLPVDALAELLGKMGISPSTLVVLYSEKNGFMPLYLLWALDYIGHKNCGVLEGGFAKWKSESRFLTQDYPLKIKTTVYPVPPKLRAEVRATVDEVRQALGRGAVLVDTRARETYAGERGAWKRRGHVPGAVHRFWNENLTADGSWKSKDELRADYSALGVTSDKKIIVYCGSGQMSSHTYFVLKHILGFPSVKNFDGGFGAWSADPQLPVEDTKK